MAKMSELLVSIKIKGIFLNSKYLAGLRGPVNTFRSAVFIPTIICSSITVHLLLCCVINSCRLGLLIHDVILLDMTITLESSGS